MPAHRLEALLAHEVSVHLLTYFNGAAQGLGIFRTGLAGYEGVQEGLGVFAEWAIGGLTRTRLRLLAGRVVAVDAMLRGARFIDVYRIAVRATMAFPRAAPSGSRRACFRSGGLAKDAIYLQGFRAVMDLVAAGASLEPFWIGKIAVGHVPAIEELLQRGLVQPPRLHALFLADEKPARADRRLAPDRTVPKTCWQEPEPSADCLFRQRPRARIRGLHDDRAGPSGGVARAPASAMSRRPISSFAPDDSLSRPCPLPAQAEVQGPRRISSPR